MASRLPGKCILSLFTILTGLMDGEAHPLSPSLHWQGRGTGCKLVEGPCCLRRTPPPSFARFPSPGDPGEEFSPYLIPGAKVLESQR